MTERIALSLGAGLGLLLLAGCGNQDLVSTRVNANTGQPGVTENTAVDTLSSNSTLFALGGSGNNSSGTGGGIGVNAFLWRGSLETLKFMPLISADPYGGVILTDWYQSASAPGERFKVAVYILGRQLEANALHISVFRQVQQGGSWLDAPVAPGVSSDLENKVLAASRDLRAQSFTTQ
jgi:hypothetical protein